MMTLAAFIVAAACLAALPSPARADGLPDMDRAGASDDAAVAANKTADQPSAVPDQAGPSILAKATVQTDKTVKMTRVDVTVRGVEQPYLIYKVDGGPAIITQDRAVRIRDLSAGKHEVTVILAGEDARPLGPSETLTVTVP